MGKELFTLLTMPTTTHRFNRKGSALLLLILLPWLAACDRRIETREQARGLILSAVIDPDTVSGEVMVFLLDSALATGAVIEPAGFPELADTLTEPAWFGWIDDEPSAEFAHATRFVFISVRNGRLRVENREWYPFLNATIPLFRDSVSLQTNAFLILNTTVQ